MSDPIQDDVSRRELLRNIGTISLSTFGLHVVSAEGAQHVHKAVTETKKAGGPYKPAYFNAAEYKTLQRLADLIIPADERSPGALAAGAPEFIDFLSSQSRELAEIFAGGLAWLDHQMQKVYSSSFVASTPDQQTAMLDLIAYRKNDSPELGPGIRFFSWVRNMTVDAYYTSKIGMDDLGFMGNGAMAEFSVPAAAIEYAVKRSGLA
ncbi:MAG TPA: gluconate 2-dehydrogenase subunit 3 family protein [Bryobacteraceae bacterium]|jgi:gluconate 2-dehydrogenase subunit 3-like protein|nr:gluconate 2-dehydrogenase subunit 3 family protein [Bryobacteraceae bacterium]